MPNLDWIPQNISVPCYFAEGDDGRIMIDEEGIISDVEQMVEALNVEAEKYNLQIKNAKV